MHCTLASLLGLVAAAATLPASSLSPRDANPGCQAASFGDFAWTVEGFDYHASGSRGYAKFALVNPALTYRGRCAASSSQPSDFFYGTVPYTCTFPEGTSARGDFSYNRPSGRLNITQKWTCTDADPVYPTVFGAKGSVVLDLQCTDSTRQGPKSDREVKCAPVDVTVSPYERTAVA